MQTRYTPLIRDGIIILTSGLIGAGLGGLAYSLINRNARNASKGLSDDLMPEDLMDETMPVFAHPSKYQSGREHHTLKDN